MRQPRVAVEVSGAQTVEGATLSLTVSNKQGRERYSRVAIYEMNGLV